jgi:hypothetical protein
MFCTIFKTDSDYFYMKWLDLEIKMSDINREVGIQR